jgi:hypothetical protein
VTGYELGLWVVIVGGLLPAGYFLWTWRPERRWTARQLDAGGWVQVVLALYLLAAFRAAFGHYRDRAGASAWAALAVGVGIDMVLWLRMVRWRRFRNDADHPMRRATDPDPTDTDS